MTLQCPADRAKASSAWDGSYTPASYGEPNLADLGGSHVMSAGLSQTMLPRVDVTARSIADGLSSPLPLGVQDSGDHSAARVRFSFQSDLLPDLIESSGTQVCYRPITRSLRYTQPKLGTHNETHAGWKNQEYAGLGVHFM